MHFLPVGKAQPEDIIGIETQRLHRTQHQHVANVKLHHSHFLPVEQDWIFEILTHHLEHENKCELYSPDTVRILKSCSTESAILYPFEDFCDGDLFYLNVSILCSDNSKYKYMSYR